MLKNNMSSRLAFALAILGLGLILYARDLNVPPQAIRAETRPLRQAAAQLPVAAPTPAPLAAIATGPENQTPPVENEPQPQAAAGSPSISNSAPPRPPPHALSYRREGELIVVFGDVLYGKLKDDDGSATGYVRARPVDLWDSNTIPYHIDPQLRNPERVQKTLQLFMEKTPIRFVAFDGQPNAIVFTPGEKDCRSYVGRIGGHQPIYLDDKCGVPEIAHELMHALGFIHEQSRPDRDRYVKINWNNIDSEHVSQFEVAPEEVARLSLTRPFDYKSTMLYDATMFAKTPGLVTIESLTAEPIEPAAEGLSREDIERISKAYSP